MQLEHECGWCRLPVSSIFFAPPSGAYDVGEDHMRSRLAQFGWIGKGGGGARGRTAIVLMALATTLLACRGGDHPEPRKKVSSSSSEMGSTIQRGRIISSELLGEKSQHDLAIEFKDNGVGSSPRYGVALYKIVYETIDAHGRQTKASGALAIPVGGGGPLPLLSYQHGTVANRSTVASQYGFDLASILFGGDGYVVAIPDYLGLGESPGLHPYVHAASLATAIVDMLRASRELCRRNNVTLSGKLFLLGYSEGGYATMAAHRSIEEEYAGEFQITASAPMAGPYDMSGTMREFFMKNSRYADPFYLPYVVLAYNDVYHLADSLGQIFAEPYAERLPKLFNGENEGFTINEELPPVPKDVLAPAFLESFRTDSLNPLRRALLENDLTRWTPRAPMRLYHCISDDRVPYDNAEVAYQRFRSRGAMQVELITLNEGGHGSCAWPSILAGKKWIDAQR